MSSSLTEAQSTAAVLHKYEAALNASSTDALVALYASDGVFMPQHFPSAIGHDAIRRVYDGVFSTITLKLKFSIAEVHVVAPEWGFVRTNSVGTTTVHATGKGGAVANQELFVLQKVDDGWKIARYCCSTTNPRPA